VGALEVLGDMHSARVQPNVVTYNSAIKACRVGLHWAGALEILDQMLVKGVPTNEETHNTLLDVFVKCHLWQTALQLLDCMSSFGVQPNVVSYNTVLNGCLSSGQWEHAAHLLSTMQRSRTAPDVVRYNPLIKGTTQREKSQNAKAPHPNVVNNGAVISSDARCWFQTLALCNGWPAADIEPDELMLMSLRKSRVNGTHKSNRTFFPYDISTNETLHFENSSETAQAASRSCNAGGGRAADIHTLSQGQSDQSARALSLLQNSENCTPHRETEWNGSPFLCVPRVGWRRL